MERERRVYADQDGFLIKVATGACKMAWATYRVKENRFLQRIKDKELPARDAFNNAQDDLDKYALQQGWKMENSE